MSTAVKMWFYILDNKKLHDLHAKDVFLAFGKKSKCSPEIAEETFLRHATFIMDNMKKMKGGSWSKKPLYQYLKRHMVKVSYVLCWRKIIAHKLIRHLLTPDLFLRVHSLQQFLNKKSRRSEAVHRSRK